MKTSIMTCLTILAATILASCNPKPYKAEEYKPEVKPESIIYLDVTQWTSVRSNDPDNVLKLWDVMHVISTVQGIVNRDAPKIYINYISESKENIDDYWLLKSTAPGKWLSDCEIITMYDIVQVAELFKDKIKGLVVYDGNVASTSNVASTIAGVEDLIAIRYDATPGSLYSRLIAHGFEPKVWLVNEDGTSMFHSKLEPYRWAIKNYLSQGKCSDEFAAYYIDQYWRKACGNATMNHHTLTNHDFFVSKKAFFFDLSPWSDEPATDDPGQAIGEDLLVLKQILLEIYNQNGGQKMLHIGGFPAWAYKYSDSKNIGGKHVATQTEWEFAMVISAYNAFHDADALSYGAICNSSFWQHYPLKEKYHQKMAWPTVDQLKAKGYVNADGKVNTSKKYFIAYVGDYDAASWLYQRTHNIWDNPDRGKVPLMWCISPILAVRAPMAMEYIWETATENDYFAAADNGAGYLNPGMLEEPRPISGLPSGVEAWARHNKFHYDRWDLSITGFIIDGNGKGMTEKGVRSYATFSPNGIVPQKPPFTNYAGLYANMPITRPDASMSDGIQQVINIIGLHPDFPFYWGRAVLQTPSWYVEVKEGVEKLRPDFAWLTGPEFFELLRMYLKEGHYNTIVSQ